MYFIVFSVTKQANKGWWLVLTYSYSPPSADSSDAYIPSSNLVCMF